MDKELQEEVLLASLRLQRQVGLLTTVDFDDTSSMYGETLYRILVEGEVEYDSHVYEDAIQYLKEMVDLYV